MKYRNLSNWNNINECETLLFFAQRLDEILFDYSLDTYKPAALNAPFLCKEALMTISEIEKGNIDKNNLTPILEELEWSIKNDNIAKEIIELNYQDLIPENKSNININIQKIHIEIISRSINPNVYLFKTQEEIIKAIGNNQKNSLDFLMKNWVTTLINIGYSKRHIHTSNKEFFFSQKNITNNNQIKEFLSLFLPYQHSFQVYFKSPSKITIYHNILKEYDIDILNKDHQDYQIILNKFAEAEEILNDDEIILHIKDVESFDTFSARKNAEETLENARNLILLYSHKTPISWSQTSISKQCCKEGLQYITNSNSAVSMIADLRPQLAAERIEYFLENISLRQGSTFDRFNRIIGLHGLCAIQDAPETQLLNLWICIETLIPSDNTKSKIENILGKSTPILCLIYIRKIVRNLLRDMLNWNKRKTRKVLSEIPCSTDDLTLKLILFLSKHHENERNELFKELDDFPLLRNRIFNISTTFSDSKKIEQLIKSHSKKIHWQIRRIYRTRNLIVHSGSTPTYLSTLIENTHEYLDSMINEIIQLSCGPRRISTFNQAFEFLRIKYEEYIKNMKKINLDNRDEITKIFIDRESRKTISEIFEDHEKSLKV